MLRQTRSSQLIGPHSPVLLRVPWISWPLLGLGWTIVFSSCLRSLSSLQRCASDCAHHRAHFSLSSLLSTVSWDKWASHDDLFHQFRVLAFYGIVEVRRDSGYAKSTIRVEFYDDYCDCDASYWVCLLWNAERSAFVSNESEASVEKSHQSPFERSFLGQELENSCQR